MQLYALDHNHEPVFIKEAMQHGIYRCPECNATVRPRMGKQRQWHFYHASAPDSCRQNGKGLAHIQLQLYIKRLLPECTLETQVQQIGRVADVLFDDVIFEIQCSPITTDEVKKRIEDYASVGLFVVWILHDHLFNKKRRHAVEHFLRFHLFYYTNFNEEGEGIIYDQYCLYLFSKRHLHYGPFPVDLRLKKEAFPLEKAPRVLLQRQKKYSFHFGGDLTDKLIEDRSFNLIVRQGEELMGVTQRPRILWAWIKYLGRLMLHVALRQSCS